MAERGFKANIETLKDPRSIQDRISQDQEFQQAIYWTLSSGADHYDRIANAHAAVAKRYSASPEEMDTAIAKALSTIEPEE